MFFRRKSINMLSVKNLGKCYKPRKSEVNWAVKNINFTANSGDVIALLGSSGAGKSTLMALLANISTPTTGFIESMGKTSGNAQLITPIDYLYKGLTTLETLNYFCTLYVLNGRETINAIDNVITQFKLQKFLFEKVGSLSNAKKHRVSLAKAFLTNPDIILLDEPTAGQDIESSYELISLINKIRMLGKVVIISTHNMSEAQQIATRVFILDKGSLICDLNINEFESLSDSLESSYMNRLEEA